MKRTFIFTSALIIYAALSLSTICFSQSVAILEKTTIANLPTGNGFSFISEVNDTVNFQFVTKLSCQAKTRKTFIEKMYFDFRKKANELGANCFSINSFIIDSISNEATLVLDCYFAPLELIDQYSDELKKNMVYIFGNDEFDNDATFTFQLNGEKKVIKSGFYFEYALKDDEEIELIKGGRIGGTILSLKGMKGKRATFLSLSGFGLADKIDQEPMSIMFKTGKINRINNYGLGYLIISLLKRQE